MKSEFDMGYRECEETKATDLYTAIENAIIDLTPLSQGSTHDAVYIHAVILALRNALMEYQK